MAALLERLCSSPAQRGFYGRPRPLPRPSGLPPSCCRQSLRVRAAGSSNGSPAAVVVPGPPGPVLPAVTPDPPTSPPSAPSQATECSPPQTTYEKLVAMGAAKAASSPLKAVLLSLMAGAFISFGGMMVLAVGASCPGLASANPGLQRLILGAFGLPMGLLLVLTTGAELFTGNTMLLPLAVLERKATKQQLLRNWAISFTGNLVGSLAAVSLVGVSGLLSSMASPAKVAAAKTSLTFVQALTRGIIANWLVCLGVWMATSASSLPGKALGAWFPVTAFAAAGAEHSVANMFSIPMGIVLAGDVTWKAFFGANLLPVVLGNVLSGSIFCALGFCLCYGRLSSAKQA